MTNQIGCSSTPERRRLGLSRRNGRISRSVWPGSGPRRKEEKLLETRKGRKRKWYGHPIGLYSREVTLRVQKLDSEATRSDLVDESQFELEEYESDTDVGKKPSGPGSSDVDGLSASTIALLERFRGHSAPHNSEEDNDNDEIKIFYCSRTHSQLTQFANELRRVSLPPSLPTPQQRPEEPSTATENTELEEGVKHLSLGSRKQLCINPHVSSLGNATAINERCMELQKPGVAAERRCPYLPSKENEAALLDFRDRTLAAVRDIEDIGEVGKQLGICPYYAARPVVKHSEVRQIHLSCTADSWFVLLNNPRLLLCPTPCYSNDRHGRR